MEKIAAHLRHSLLQHLLQVGKSAPAQAQPALTMAPNSAPAAQISVPPALRQLLAQHAPNNQLLPLIQSNNQVAGNLSPALLRTLASQLQLPLATLANPTQLRTLVSNWFATNPVTALTQPPSTQSANWLQSLRPALLLSLLQQLPATAQNAPAGQLLQQVFGGNAATPGLFTPALLNQLQGSLSQIRLSQVQLADSSALQQPDYYLVFPYQQQGQPRELELLLRRRQQTSSTDEESSEAWLFSLRLVTDRLGAMLVKGRWDGEQAQLRFYTQDDSASRWLSRQLPRLHERVQAAGIAHIETAAHTGRVPDTLAPQPNELIRVHA
ncbi:flagellar hook-length control protein FliK [Aliidiomarina sp. Khilg15.8]